MLEQCNAWWWRDPTWCSWSWRVGGGKDRDSGKFKVSTQWRLCHLSPSRLGKMAQIWGLVLQWGYFWTLTRVTFWQIFTKKRKKKKKKSRLVWYLQVASTLYLVFTCLKTFIPIWSKSQNTPPGGTVKRKGTIRFSWVRQCRFCTYPLFVPYLTQIVEGFLCKMWRETGPLL